MLVSDQKHINFGPTKYQNRTKKMLVSDQPNIRIGSIIYQFRTTGYQKRVKSMLFSGHAYINFRSLT